MAQVSLFAVICLSLLYFIYGRELVRQVETSDRYYIGVGIKFNGVTTVGSVLFDGPAYKVGIKEGDIILAVNSQPVAGLNAEEISRLLQNGWPRSVVNLKVLRTNPTVHEFEVQITRRVIDRAEWVSFVRPLTSGSEIRDGQVSFYSKVTEDKSRSTFRYFCRIQNKGEREYTIAWEVLDEIYGQRISVQLKPGEVKEFSQESPRVPKVLVGFTSIYSEITPIARGVASGYVPDKF
jgi:membrane-associated protease RseP (regulator of RpoE activity)